MPQEGEVSLLFLQLVVARQKNYILFVCAKFTSKISLVISLHDGFTTGAMAADKNCITRSEVVSRKVLNNLKRKTSLWRARALSKRQTVRILLPLSLRTALRKSRRKFFAYLINC